MSDRTTRFDASTVSEALSYDARYAHELPTGVASYAAFRELVAIETADDLKRRVLDRLDHAGLAGATFYTTSGTSGEVKLLLNAPSRKRPDTTYGRSLANALAGTAIAPTDRVANLFTAGGFSTLYDGVNRLLEAIGANVLPMGGSTPTAPICPRCWTLSAAPAPTFWSARRRACCSAFGCSTRTASISMSRRFSTPARHSPSASARSCGSAGAMPPSSGCTAPPKRASSAITRRAARRDITTCSTSGFSSRRKTGNCS
ncbi:hypothetical protein [Burkholderia glumae]|uniref:hypothetical protein n=1 Tax=Burkholderia glumae TaxID=337 RepID=UPI003BA1C13F